MTPSAPTAFSGTANDDSSPIGPFLVAVADSLEAAELAVTAGADIVDLCLCGTEDARAFLARHPTVAFCADSLPASPLESAASLPVGHREREPQGTSAVGQSDDRAPFPGPDRRPSLTHRPERAAPGTALTCPNLAEARRSGLPADRIVVVADATCLANIIQAGYAACVDVDPVPPSPHPAHPAPSPHPAHPAPSPHPADASPQHAANASPQHAAQLANPGSQTAASDQAVRAATAAALATWSGARLIRTRQVLAVRRAIDMTLSISGARPPARAVRGLA